MCFSFFGLNIECFECLKLCALNVLRHQSRMGELFYWPSFHQVI